MNGAAAGREPAGGGQGPATEMAALLGAAEAADPGGPGGPAPPAGAIPHQQMQRLLSLQLPPLGALGGPGPGARQPAAASLHSL